MKSEVTSQVVGTATANAGMEGESDFTIGELFRTFLGYKKFLIFSIIFGGIVAALIAYSQQPVYEATATIRIDPQRANSLGLQLTSAAGGGSEELDTDIAIAKSESVAIDALNLLPEAEYRKFAGVPKSVGAVRLDVVNQTPMQQAILSRLQGNLAAKQVGTTQIVSISYRSNDPQLAADVANAVVSAYLKESFDSRYTSVQQIRGWLSGEMQKLRDEASQAQRKLTGFQEENNIIETTSGGSGPMAQSSNITLDTLRQLNTSLTTIRAERLTREAQMRAAKEASPEVVALMFPSTNLGALLAERTTLNDRIALLSAKFGERWPPLAEARQELEANRRQYDAAVAELRQRVESDYATASQSEQALQNEYDKQVKLAYAQNRQEAEYAVLNAEARSASVLYDTLQTKLQQAGLDAGLNAVNIFPVDRAHVPFVPVEPKKTLIVGVGLFVGLFLGVGIVLLREVVSDAVVNPEQLEHRFGLHVLTLVPHILPVTPEGKTVPKTSAEQENGTMLVAQYASQSRATEAFRSLRNSLLLSQRNVKTVLVSSVYAAEGKSITSVNLAIVMAQKGARVLMVDADLRRPMIHNNFRLPNSYGLGDMIMAQEMDVTPHLQTPIPELPSLQVLTAGSRTKLPSELLSSTHMYNLMERWERDFDYVILDSAPLLVVSDSMSMARWADELVLVVRAERTPMKGLRRLRVVLAQAQTQVTGVVLNDVSDKSQAYGGYGYASYGSYYE